MKCSVVLLVFLSGIILVSAVSVHNGMMFYQAPMYYNMPPHPPVYTPQQSMLVHYEHPYKARSALASEVAAFAAGETIGAETYLHDINDQIAQKPASENQPAVLEDSNTSSVAEAYPESDDSLQNDDISFQNEVIQQQDIIPEPEVQPTYPKKKNPKEYIPPIEQDNQQKPVANDDSAAAEQPNVDDAAPDVPAIVPSKKKKIHIELDENDEDEDSDFVPFNTNVKRPNKGSNGSNYPWPVNTFFPLNFGSTSGGAIAVANSFSTGKGGTATSHATAYGSSAKQKRKRLGEEK